MFQKLLKNLKEKKKGFSMIELAIYIIIISTLMAVGAFAFVGYQDRAKRSVTMDELNTLSQAILTYTADSKTGSLPANLGALITGLTAAQSIDGVAHGQYVTKTGWTSDSTTFIDGWGNAYTYNSGARTISSTNNGGTAIVKSF